MKLLICLICTQRLLKHSTRWTSRCHYNTGEAQPKTQRLNFNIAFVFLGLHLWCMELSQARGLIRAVAASLCHSHSNIRSELGLQLAPQLTEMLDP